MATVEHYLNDPRTTEAERDLIEACRKGMACRLGDLPPETGDAPTVRAELIRLLAMGDAEKSGLHQTGVVLVGARIIGVLDLRFATCRGRLSLQYCRFDQPLRLQQAKISELLLNQSTFPALYAQNSTISGDMNLSGATPRGTLHLTGATIGGQLNLIGTEFRTQNEQAIYAQNLTLNGSIRIINTLATSIDISGAKVGGHFHCYDCELGNKLGIPSKHGHALNAQAIQVAGSTYLRRLKVTEAVSLNNSQIGIHFSCEDIHFQATGKHLLNLQGISVSGSMVIRNPQLRGAINLNESNTGGNLEFKVESVDNATTMEITAQSLSVKHWFIFKCQKATIKTLNLSSAHVSDLAADGSALAGCLELQLDGFTYDRLSGDNAVRTFDACKQWLDKGSLSTGVFASQPYTQFAKVMRASGHVVEARKTLMERDTILFREAKKADQKLLDEAWGGTDAKRGDYGKIWCRLHLRQAWAWLSNAVIGHGHMPQRALKKALWAWGIGTIVYFWAYNAGLMVPNSDTILTSSDWAKAVEQVPHAPVAAWQQKGLWSSVHYESFMSAIYALDLFLPITDLGQEKAWRVSTATPAGAILRGISFVYQIAGWVIVSLGIAAVTGFVQRNDPE